MDKTKIICVDVSPYAVVNNTHHFNKVCGDGPKYSFKNVQEWYAAAGLAGAAASAAVRRVSIVSQCSRVILKCQPMLWQA